MASGGPDVPHPESRAGAMRGEDAAWLRRGGGGGGRLYGR